MVSVAVWRSVIAATTAELVNVIVIVVPLSSQLTIMMQ